MFDNNVFSLLPPFLREHACIAGGFAACPTRAGDIDLWILNFPGRSERVWDQITEHLRANEIKFRESNFSYAQTNGSVLRLVCKKVYLRKKNMLPDDDEWLDVQILEASQATVHDLIDAFDISTHMIARTQTDVVRGKHYTSTTETPVVMRFDKPEGVVARLDKICKRYDIVARPDDLAELEILTQAEAVNDGLSEDKAVGF